MKPVASSTNARNTMRANRSVSSREVVFRRALWRAGARGYRLQTRLPGRPDLVFPRLRLAIFVNGCFWHRCPACHLPAPRSNGDFWRTKLDANVARDKLAIEALTSLRWSTLVVWEHEIRPDPGPRAQALAKEIRELRTSLSLSGT